MTKKELWDYQFSRELIRTCEYRPANCSICNNQYDKRDLKEFKCFEDDASEYICRDCFLK